MCPTQLHADTPRTFCAFQIGVPPSVGCRSQHRFSNDGTLTPMMFSNITVEQIVDVFVSQWWRRASIARSVGIGRARCKHFQEQKALTDESMTCTGPAAGLPQVNPTPTVSSCLARWVWMIRKPVRLFSSPQTPLTKWVPLSAKARAQMQFQWSVMCHQ